MSRDKLFTVTIGDCRVDTFRAGGKGGQAQNKKSTGVRVVHEPSGAVGESREERSQLQNKRTAFRRMSESDRFKRWTRTETARILGVQERIEREVDAMLAPSNLKIEVKDESGRWVDHVG